MFLVSLLLAGSLAAPTDPQPSTQDESLLAAVPGDAFALVHVADPAALRARAEHNAWVKLYASDDGEAALVALEQEYEEATGVELDGLFDVAMQLEGEALLFFTGEVAGFLTAPPQDRSALASVLDGWLTEEPRRALEVAGASVQLAPWPQVSDEPSWRTGRFLAFFDHPRALGLYSGDNEEALLETLADSLGGLAAGERRAPAVEGFLASGGGTSSGVEAFVDFTPFVPEWEQSLREDVEGVLPDPTGLLGLDQGTWLFASADVSPGTAVEVHARLRIPPDTLAARLADSFEPLPTTLPADLPRGSWLAYALEWNLGLFYATAREAFEKEAEEGELQVVDSSLEAAELLSGVDPVEDVMNQLSGLFALYHVLDQTGKPVDGEFGFGLLLGLVDGELFLDAFEALLGAGGMGVNPIELEGAETYLLGENATWAGDPEELEDRPDFDGGLSILPHRMLASMSRDTLVRGLRALGRQEDAGVSWGSELQGAYDENAGACAFAFAELTHLRQMALMQEGGTAPEEGDPFLESQLIFTGKRIPEGFEARLYTR